MIGSLPFKPTLSFVFLMSTIKSRLLVPGGTGTVTVTSCRVCFHRYGRAGYTEHTLVRRITRYGLTLAHQLVRLPLDQLILYRVPFALQATACHNRLR